MARSLSLAAYLIFARRQPAQLQRITQPRGEGELVWLHAANAQRTRTLGLFARRLISHRLGLRVLMTTSPGNSLVEPLPEGIIWQECPSENPTDIRAFLDHWRPDLLIWLGPWLRPALLFEARQSGVASMLLEAGTPKLENRRWRWIPEPTRATLHNFDAIFSINSTTAVRFRKMLSDGITAVAESGPLLEESQALPVDENDLEEVRATLAGRPVWLAAHLQPQEAHLVLSAHRKVLRFSHRMILIAAPDHTQNASDLRKTIADTGLRFSQWSKGEFPDDNTQILLADSPDEMGLWYRVAPVTLMGSSLVPGFGGRDPLEPAALGSAVLYGPGVRKHLDAYTRLSQVGGALIVKDTNTLADALTKLTAPDQVAEMAHAGWQVMSEGAKVSDQILMKVQNLLNQRKKIQ
ncbi:3-deoxy-D-manno-octulosonic acid transferase [Pseudopelagicola sp. nBUS_20]|uniref:3-deoxy-D-manno-octulosonic acid transferase n=1 Tax=Pseudopelagicola sp. nBUS_20 TaxID=3395317 RepID=UPI003EB9070D